jgi:hypothetical protein
MRRLYQRGRSESGEGLVSGLILIAGVLLPVMFLVPLFGRLEQARLVAEQAARDAVRVAVEAPDAATAQADAQSAAARAQPNSYDQIQLTLDGAFGRGNLLRATTTVHVDLARVPFYGTIGTVTVHGQATAPVDQYRSIPASP